MTVEKGKTRKKAKPQRNGEPPNNGGTFLMVFLIQNSENRDGAAIQIKLDELIRVSAEHNSFVGIEHLTDEELEDIRNKCERRAKAEKVGEAEVKRTGEKAADRAVAAV